MAAVPGILRRWNPGIIPGLQFWVDATDNSSISSNVNGTVNSIRDKSANSVLMSQPTSGNQPTMAIGPSKNSVIEFGDYTSLRTTNFPKTFSNSRPISQISIFNIISHTDPPVANHFLTVLKSFSVNGMTLLLTTTQEDIFFNIFDTSLQLQPVSQNTVFTEGFYNSNLSKTAYALYNYGTTTIVANNPNNYVPQLSNFIIGNGYSSMCEVIFYDNYHYDTLYMRQLEGYLAWKWKITNFLPEGHAYKNRPPS